jgi:dTDP-4-amino-4,6-dideoxygalactose transaminase
LGDAGVFAFYPNKQMTTGEGGMVVTDDDRIAGRIKVLGLHGMSKDAWKRFSDEGYKHYQVIHAGFKYNMMDIQAAMGIHQLRRVDKYWERRRDIWETYNVEFKDLPCFLPADSKKEDRHSFHLYTPLIDIDRIGRTRDWVLEAMTAENIGVGVHYLPIHSHPYYRKMFGWRKGDYPNAEWIGERTVSLPISPSISDEEMNSIISAFRKVLLS